MHAEQRGENSPMKEQEQRTVSYIKKGSNNRIQTEEYETKLEQIVSAVKEGFKTQNDFLSNTIREQTKKSKTHKQTKHSKHLMHKTH